MTQATAMPPLPGRAEFPLPLKSLLDAGVHFGHQTKRWNPKMKQFIFGQRNGIHIIDLDQTVRLFARAFYFVEETVSRGGNVLFIGTKRQAQEIIKEEASRCGAHYVVNRWLGGTLTNFRTIKQGLERMRQQIEMLPAESYWANLAKLALGDDLSDLQRSIALEAVSHHEGAAAQVLDQWEHDNRQALERAQRLLAELRDTPGGGDLAMLSVALRELRNLV